MATKAFKKEKIKTIEEIMSKAKVAIVSDYKGLSVSEITDLRRKLQEEKGDFTVLKNTLAKIAIKGTKFEQLEQFLKGPSAIAIGFEDEVSPAKVITKFLKDNKKIVLEIKGGVLDGKAITPNQVKEISNLPSKPELYAKMLGCINSPAQGLVNTVNGVARGLVTAMEAIRKQKEEQAQ
ncbi:MAG TPA: 50S ribosomal protein L10 [Candidatus Gastranaerophilales bacterium]|nr:50S ribosomal protein L10 [Candidatus Gastranaerophilales bacterium]